MAWRRPTLPRLVTQYHGRGGVSRPSSGWARVGHPRCRPPGRPTAPAPRSPVPWSPRWLAGKLAVVVGGGGVVGMGAAPSSGAAVRARARARGAVAAGGVEVARAIRTGKLRASPRFHPRPIDVVVSHGPRARPGLEEGFPLRCLQRLSRPGLATRLRGWRHDRSTRGPSAPVLSYWGRPLASLEHPRQIGTELSHDVLNPAHVPL